MKYNRPGSYERGYAALLLVILFSAVSIVFATSLSNAGFDSLNSYTAIEQSRGALLRAHGCAELALEQIATNASYAGAGNDGTSSCSYTVTQGSQIVVQASGITGAMTRKVRISLTPVTLAVTEWIDVAN